MSSHRTEEHHPEKEGPVAVDVSALRGHLQEQEGAMLRLLRELVAIESPSDVPAAQHAVFERLAETLEPVGYTCSRWPGAETGGQLFARPARRSRGQPVQLLLGHADTVWPEGTLETMPIETRDGRLHGPGVYDMKAGLVQMVFAVRAMAQLGWSPRVTPVLLVTSDEEIGSPESRPRIRRLARVAHRTLVAEPALGPEGKLKTARKGIGRFQVTVDGVAAHAGLDPEGGASAIDELAHVIHTLHGMTRLDEGITLNVGVVEGGDRPNVIAPWARAQVDVRARTQAQAEALTDRLQQMTATTPGVSLTVTGSFGRPPMERTPRNRQLWQLARRAGRLLNLNLQEARAGGGSDGNETSLFSATLDGLGPVGDGAHASHEHIQIDRLVERCALLTLLLMADPLPQPNGSS